MSKISPDSMPHLMPRWEAKRLAKQMVDKGCTAKEIIKATGLQKDSVYRLIGPKTSKVKPKTGLFLAGHGHELVIADLVLGRLKMCCSGRSRIEALSRLDKCMELVAAYFSIPEPYRDGYVKQMSEFSKEIMGRLEAYNP